LPIVVVFVVEVRMRNVIRIWLVLSTPIVLTMVMVRALTMPWYPAWEYGRPGFPEDPYGMEPARRLRLARAAIRYLNRPRNDAILATLELPDGSPAFNERELSHMVDVKRVYDRLTLAATGMLVIAVAGTGYLATRDEIETVGRGLRGGGILTLALIGFLALWMLVGFNAFFTWFHRLFFEGGTWLFRTSDTLIRLFPIQFWQDGGLLVAGGVSVLAVIFVFVGHVLARRGDV
jgi:integral membrane protein (TIGR01906 family)